LLIWCLRNLIYIVITFVKLIERRITDGFVTCSMGLANNLCVRTLSIIFIILFSAWIESGVWSAILIMLSTHYSVTILSFAISILTFRGFSRVDEINIVEEWDVWPQGPRLQGEDGGKVGARGSNKTTEQSNNRTLIRHRNIINTHQSRI
jgi:hypothetical protein